MGVCIVCISKYGCVYMHIYVYNMYVKPLPKVEYMMKNI